MQNTKPFTEITTSQLQQRISENRNQILIDTLPGDRFEKRHLPGAVNASVFEVTFPQKIETLAPDKDGEIVLYGSSNKSMDAVTAAEKLERLGYRNVYTLSGGLAAWQESGYPLEGEDTETPVASEAVLSLADRTYNVDTGKSIIEWAGRNPNVKHHGTLRLSKGEIKVSKGVIGGTFEVDLESIENINLAGDELQPVLIDHLKSDDFFFVKMFPKAVFTIQTARSVKEPTLSIPNYEIEGTLKLRGVGAEIAFPATVSNLPDGGITAEAHFDIDRTRWNIIYGSSRFFEHLGMHLVFDPISIQVRIIAY